MTARDLAAAITAKGFERYAAGRTEAADAYWDAAGMITAEEEESSE